MYTPPRTLPRGRAGGNAPVSVEGTRGRRDVFAAAARSERVSWNRRTFLSTVAGAGAAASAVVAGAPSRASQSGNDGGRATYRNPVFAEVFADPTAIRADDGTYYAYATFHDWGGDPARPRLIPIARSDDLVSWSYAGEVFETKPDWKDSGGLWAPEIARLGGRYVLYYFYARFGDPNPGIGVATADAPTGPFEDHGMLLRSQGIGVPNSIDPCLVEHGGPTLFWGSKQGIYGVDLAPDGRSLAGDPVRIAGDGVEAPYVVRRNGRWYFFGSRGTCCVGADSTYHVVVGRSDSLDGPYRNREGESLLDATGTTILHGSDYFAGPGHNAVVRDDAGDDWLLYHAYERSDPWAGEAPRRVLMLDRLSWTDGWPTVEGNRPSRVAPVPTVDGSGTATG